MSYRHAVVNETGLLTAPQRPQLVRWGSVFAGSVIGLATFILLNALWLALSFGSHDSVVYSNLSWWIAGTAIFCILLASLIAGLSSGARGLAAGSVSGLTTWGLVVIAVGVVVLSTFSINDLPKTLSVSGTIYSINYLSYWAAFWSLLIGLGAGLLGGMIGGAVPRSVDEPYLDLRTAVARETVAAPAAPVDRAAASVEQPTGPVPVVQAASVPVTPTSPPVVANATGPFVYEHR
jgi:hypothetical protein